MENLLDTRVAKNRLAIIFFSVYFAVGLIVAQQHHYFSNLGTFKKVASAFFAVLWWWLVLLGVNVQFKVTWVDI
jgi:Na+/H+-dicarboxylate symporter